MKSYTLVGKNSRSSQENPTGNFQVVVRQLQTSQRWQLSQASGSDGLVTAADCYSLEK